MALALTVFTAAFLLISSLGVLLFYRQKTPRRLSQVILPPVDASLLRSIAPPPGSKIERLVKPFHKLLPRNPEDVSSVQKRLARAGLREKSCVNIFYSSRVLVPGVLCILATVTGLYEYAPLLVYSAAAGLGFLAPDFWLRYRVASRQTNLRLGLPE